MTHLSMTQSLIPTRNPNTIRSGLKPGDSHSKPWTAIYQSSVQRMGKLLLICEEEMSRRILKVVLETAGYRVIEALTVNEGMKLGAPPLRRPDVAVIVADLDGGIWASLDILRSALQGSPLLVMSPDEVGWLLDALDGNEEGYHGQWLARVNLVLKEGAIEIPSTLSAA